MRYLISLFAASMLAHAAAAQTSTAPAEEAAAAAQAAIAPRAVAPRVSTGPQLWSCKNPIVPENRPASACVKAVSYWDATEAQLFRANGNPNQELTTIQIESTAWTGGNNEPMHSFGKTTYFGSKTTGTYGAMGQHVLVESTQNCFGIGDCLIGSHFLNHANGMRDSSDEGVHFFDQQINEVIDVPSGRCLRGCSPGSELLSVDDAEGWGTAGEGRYLGDLSRASVGAGAISGLRQDRELSLNEILFTGAKLPVSTLFKISSTPESRPGEISPGNVHLQIATTGLPRGFSSTTATIPPHGVLCLTDFGGNNPEMTQYLVLDATHLSMTLYKQHGGATLAAVGGTCGLGISLIADEAHFRNHKSPLRQVIPIFGSRSADSALLPPETSLGRSLSSNAYLSVRCPILSSERHAGKVTLEAGGGDCWYMNGLVASVTGAGIAGLDGKLPAALKLERVTDRGALFTVAAKGPDAAGEPGGTLSFSNGAYRLIPIAETERVVDPATGKPDGSDVVLFPNLVPFTANDDLEQFHFHLALTGNAGEQFQTQYTPEMDVPTNTTGVVFAGGGGEAVVAPGKIGFRCSNGEADSKLLGYGGTHIAPWTCFRADGGFRNILNAEWTTESTILRLHPLHEQMRNATPFWLVFIQPGNGNDSGLHYVPETHALEFSNLHAVAGTYTTTRGTPKSSSEPCSTGESWDATDAAGHSFHYFCKATNQIVRAAMESF